MDIANVIKEEKNLVTQKSQTIIKPKPEEEPSASAKSSVLVSEQVDLNPNQMF